MLEALLEEMKKGNTTSPVVLAERLGVSTAMIQAMLSTLEDQGYLKTVTTECNPDKPCGSCPVASLCGSKTGNNPRILVMNNRGK